MYVVVHVAMDEEEGALEVGGEFGIGGDLDLVACFLRGAALTCLLGGLGGGSAGFTVAGRAVRVAAIDSARAVRRGCGLRCGSLGLFLFHGDDLHAVVAFGPAV